MLSCVDLERDTLTSVELAAARDLRTDIKSTQGQYLLGVFVIVSVLVSIWCIVRPKARFKLLNPKP